VKRLPATLIGGLIGAYRRLISPAIPRRCRYEPTCSSYAAQAVRELGVVRGGIVALWRLLRCNPFSHGGLDPLEQRSLFRTHGHCAHPPADPHREAHA